RFFDNDGHKFRFHRAVNLDLHVAELGVLIDPLAGLFRRSGENFHRAFVRTGSIDEASYDNAWAYLLALLDVLLEFGQIVNRVCEIAPCGDARGDVEYRKVGEEVLVHVPKTGKQHLSRTVDDLRT